MDKIVIDETRWADMFAIKVNNKNLLREYRYGENNSDRILTVSTEKKAQKEVAIIKKRYSNLDLKIVAVEEEIHIDSEKGIIEQSIREL